MVKILGVIALILVWIEAAWGDIYKYVDSRGVIHFTNVPSTPAYRLYMREERASRPVSPQPQKGNYTRPRLNPAHPAIRHAAKRHGLDHSLITAVIKVESDFDPAAVSSKGAKGLMQLMPATAKELGVRDSFDPLENLDGGVRYLRQLLDFFDGNLPLALAAYNAGRETVIQYGGIPPYPETRDYVAKVLYFYNLFRQHNYALARDPGQ